MRIAKALEYMEAHLDGELDLEAAARAANCSSFHFFRMFDVIAGMGPGEYVRRRRLSEAALALAAGSERVIDVALRFGYDSPDSFGRAFKREFGCAPSKARSPGTPLHSYPPLSFRIVLKGDKAMEFRIEEGKEIALAGIGIRVGTADGANFQAVTAFWDRSMADGRCAALCAKMDGSRLGMIGVCRDFDVKSGDFTYSIAVDDPGSMDGMPPGSERFSVPACTWGKFASRGPLRPNFQETIKRIFSEWLPASDWEHSGSAEIEYYGDGDPGSDGYRCEYWIPLRKK
jgi:AraC family transcriptional regulator